MCTLSADDISRTTRVHLEFGMDAGVGKALLATQATG